MANLPVFKSSGNINQDLKKIEVAKALGFGYWKGQIGTLGEKVNGSFAYINGEPTIPNFRVDGNLSGSKTAYGKRLAKYLENLGMTQKDFSEIASIWSEDRVSGINLIWKEQLVPTRELFGFMYEDLIEEFPDLNKIEMTYENTVHYKVLDYPTPADRPAVEEVLPASFGPVNNYYGQPSDTIGIVDTTVLKLLNSIGSDLTHIEETESSRAMIGLMLMYGQDLMPLLSVEKISERSYFKTEGLGQVEYIAVTSKVIYEGTMSTSLSDDKVDVIVDNGTKYTTGRGGFQREYWTQNLANTFWQYVFKNQDKIGNRLTIKNKFTEKFFILYDNNLYLKVNEVKRAGPEELKFLFANYIDFRVTTKTEWYDPIVKFFVAIFTAIKVVGQGVFDFIMNITPIGLWVNIIIGLSGYILERFGVDFDRQSVVDFLRDNIGRAIVTIATLGISAKIQIGLETLKQLLFTAVEKLAEIGLTIISQILYVATEVFVFILDTVVSQVADVRNLLNNFSNSMFDLIQQIEFGEQQQEILEAMKEIEKLQEELDAEKETESYSFTDGIEDEYDLLGKLEKQFDMDTEFVSEINYKGG
ncbi:MAG: hypothetical protein K0U20_09405 [Proteobacteria bacterium]|nr:hypothetical protein [Pseudomonadota bacterium]MCH9735797.1 hypothetical protein [Actinomycetes bacterium]